MRLNEISLPHGRKSRKTKRLGRGDSSGRGSTAGRGHKGQKARAGGFHKLGFEGGQMPLSRRLPKKGFTSINARRHSIINVGQLADFPSGSEINYTILVESKKIKKSPWGVKLLSKGDISNSLNLKVSAASKAAITKIENAGGKVEIAG